VKKLKILLIFTAVFFAQAEAGSLNRLIVDRDSLYLRAGPNQNFEVLKNLKKGEILKKVSEKYGWTEVELSTDIRLYISRDYISQKGSLGIINADRVNVRAAPSLNAAVLGQLNKEDTVSIINSNVDWIEIAAPKGFTGWTKSEYLGDYSADIIENEKSQDLKDETIHSVSFSHAELKKEFSADIVENEKASSNAESKKEFSVDVFKGRVEDVGRVFSRKSKYKLVTPEDGKYYLTGFDAGIVVYLDREVTIEGELISENVIKVIKMF